MQAYPNPAPIPYSDPADCRPQLTEFTALSRGGAEAEVKLPEDCTSGPYAQIGRLAGNRTERLYLHIYKGTTLPLRLRVYGVYENGRAVALTPCLTIRAIAHRLRVLTRDVRFDHLLLRFQADARTEPETAAADGGATVSIAAYDGAEPTSAGSIARRKPTACQDEGDPEAAESETLPFSCDGGAVQRILLSTCAPGDDLRAWVEATGLEVSEAYYGELGSVVALGAPPGMDLNTIGGSASKVRSEMETVDGEVDPDYLINLFNPERPARCDGRLRYAADDEEGKGSGGDHLRELLGRNEYVTDFDRSKDPLTVTIIDSGVDHSAANSALWEATRYRGRKQTAFIRPWKLGYDFIDGDYYPEDVAPHGTYVAATLLAQYRSKRPLELVHLKTFGGQGISSLFGALVSIYEAAAIGSRVINMSWGIYVREAPAALTCAVATAARAGVFMVTSAGNAKSDLGSEPQWPASYAAQGRFQDHVLTVASYWFGKGNFDTDESQIDLRRDFSNFGDEEASVAAFMTAGVPKYRSGEMVFPLGTSISAPIVSGLLAHFLAEFPGGTLAQFRDKYFLYAGSISDRIVKGSYLPLDHTVVLT